MDSISEEEREHFLVAGGNERDHEEDGGDEEECKSLNETDNATVSFLDGKKHAKKRYIERCTPSVPGAIIGRCKSVEMLRDINNKSECLHKKFSSVNAVNYKQCDVGCNSKQCEDSGKQCVVELSTSKLNSEMGETNSKDGITCKCREDAKCVAGNLGEEERVVHCEGGRVLHCEGIKPGVVSVKLQHLNGQILPDFTADSEGVFLMQQHRAFAITRDICHYETSQSSDSVICRICHSAGDEKLIAPCKCAGSSRYVHEPCLVTWFKKSVKNECELCRSEVKIKKINHNLARWRKPEDRPIPLIWFSVFFIGLFLNILSIHVNASEYCKSTACLIFYIVNGFGIILDSAFLYFWFLKCRHYCKKWFALNQDWFIDDLDKLSDNTPVQYVRNEEEKPV